MDQLHIVIIKKQGLTLPELWIPGIFESNNSAVLFITSLPDELASAATIHSYNLSFPFFIVEKLTEDFSFAQTSTEALEFLDAARDSVYDPIVYLVRQPWHFENGADNMGTLEQIHVDEETNLQNIKEWLQAD
jgi:hypothetical protein